MKKKSLTLLTACLLSAPSMATAATDIYNSHSGGLALSNNSMKHTQRGNKRATYLSFSGGIATQDNATENSYENAIEYKSGGIFNIAYGFKSENWRVEAELGYQKNDMDIYRGYIVDSLNRNYGTTADMSIVTLMANAYYDFDTRSSVAPYVIGGIGVAAITQTWTNSPFWYIPDGEFTASSFAWQIGAGFGIKASDKTTIDLGYRYLKPSDADLGNYITTLGGSNVTVGVRVDLR